MQIFITWKKHACVFTAVYEVWGIVLFCSVLDPFLFTAAEQNIYNIWSIISKSWHQDSALMIRRLSFWGCGFCFGMSKFFHVK